MMAVAVAFTSVTAGSLATKKTTVVKAQETSKEVQMPIVVYDHLDDHFLFEFDLANLMGLGLYQDYTEPGVPKNAGKGLVETELGENGTPVYKKETVERAAKIMKEYIEQGYKVDNELHNKIRNMVSIPGEEVVVTNEKTRALNLKDNGWSVPNATEYVAKERGKDTWSDAEGNVLYTMDSRDQDKLITKVGSRENKAVLDFGELEAGKYTLSIWQYENMNIIISCNGVETVYDKTGLNQEMTVELKENGHIILTAIPTSNEAFITNPSLYYGENRNNAVINNANVWHSRSAKESGWIYEEGSSWTTSGYGGITCEDGEQTKAYIEMDVEPGRTYIVKAETNESDLMVAEVATLDGTKLADVNASYDKNNSFIVPESVDKVRLYIAPKGEGSTTANEGKKVRRFDNVYIKQLAEVKLGDYEETKKAFSVDNTKTKLDDIETCMDYIYYMVNNFWSDTSNDVTQRTNLFKTLTLTLDEEEKVYEFDNSHKIIYDVDKKDISNKPDEIVENQGFSPIDDSVLGEKSDFTAPFGKYDVEYYDEAGQEKHNFHYAMKAHCEFYYDKSSELEFNFSGDDDVYLFINNKLALDIGGAHTALEGNVKINDIADELGLEDGEVYTFDFFYMERHTTASNIRIHTNMVLLPADAKSSVLFKDKDGNVLEDGAKVNAGDKVSAEYSVKAGVKGMSNITFNDDAFGTKIGKEGLELGECEVDGKLEVKVTDKEGNVVETVSISKDDLNDAEKVKEFTKAVGNLKLDKDNTATVTGLVRKMPLDSVLTTELNVDITAPQITYDSQGRVVFVDESVKVNPTKSYVIPKNDVKADIEVKITDSEGNELTSSVTEGTNVFVEYKLTAKSVEMSNVGIDDNGTGFKINGERIVIPEGYNIDNGLTVTFSKNGQETTVVITKDDIDNKTEVYAELLSNLSENWSLDNDDFISVKGLNTNITSAGVVSDAKGSIVGTVPSYDEETGNVTVDNKEVNPTDKASLAAKPNVKVDFVIDPDKGSAQNDKTTYIVDIGDKTNGEPTVIPEDGYEFTGWQKTTETSDVPVDSESPKDDVITENTTFTAVFTPKKYTYTIKYVDEDGNEISDSKSGDPSDFNSEVSEDAIAIDGYELNDDPTKTIVITTDPETNVITFTYKKKTATNTSEDDENLVPGYNSGISTDDEDDSDDGKDKPGKKKTNSSDKEDKQKENEENMDYTFDEDNNSDDEGKSGITQIGISTLSPKTGYNGAIYAIFMMLVTALGGIILSGLKLRNTDK